MIKFKYKPLPYGLTIAESPINGLGLYATKTILSQSMLGITHGIFHNQIWRSPLGGFINHADKPNCQLIMADHLFHLKTIDNIQPGTELTVHYSLEQQ